jgi:hypothetical protein
MTDLILTPVLAAATAKRPRRRVVHKGEGGRKKSPHNFVAEGGKRRPGAPLGNRNAACRDPDLLDRRARLKRVQTLVDQTLALAQAAMAAADEADRARQRLATALLQEVRP